MDDVFNQDAYGIVSVTDALNDLKFVPGRIGQLGLFTESSVATTSIAIERKGNILTLVAPTPRGGPGITMDKSKASIRSFAVPHFEINDAINADEVQGVRAFGTENRPEMLAQKIVERGAEHTQSHEATIEYSRIGAIKGLITYADGSTFNLFTEFGVSQESEIDFDLDNASPAAGAFRKKCAGVMRQVAGILEGVPFSGLHAFCGDAFFDDLISHKEVRETYLATQEARELRTSYVASSGLSYGAFEFGGIMWENYRGKIGATDFIHTDKCHIFPTGVAGLFRTYFAPADYNETVNTLGKRLYGKVWPKDNGKGYNLDSQTNNLNLCTRPKVLIQGKRT